MNVKEQVPYVHDITGDVKMATPVQAQFLGDHYKPVEFTRNKDGQPVMRLQLQHATVDITEAE